MLSSNDESPLAKQRRRYHAEGDHRMCKPSNCEVLAPDKPAGQSVAQPAGLVSEPKRARAHKVPDQPEKPVVRPHVMPTERTDPDPPRFRKPPKPHRLDVVPPLSLPVPVSHEFGPEGTELWDGVIKELGTLGPLVAVILVEACRLADRLAEFNRILNGGDKQWFYGRWATDGSPQVRVVVTGMLTEARETATTLKGLVQEIRTATQSKDVGKGPVGVSNALGDIRKRVSNRS